MVGSTNSSITTPTRLSPASGTGEYAPIPPVFGPRSPSSARLKSWDGASGTARRPSHTARTDSSGPLRPSSITTVRPAGPNAAPASFAFTSSSASINDSVTSTPLPAARPSVLTTNGGFIVRKNSNAGPTSVNVRYLAVGTPALATSSFIQPLDPSSCAPSAP